MTVKSQPSRLNFLAEKGDSGMNKVVNVHRLFFQGKFSVFDPGEIEKVVDQADLEFDVATQTLKIRTKHGGQRIGSLPRRESCQNRSKRCSQFMRKGREKLVLGLARRFDFLLGTNQLALGLLVSRKISEDQDDPAHSSI